MIQSGLLFAAGQADLETSEGPDAAPSNCSSYTVSGDKIGVQWTNGDVLSETQIARTADVDTDPDFNDVEFTAPAGATNWESTHDANQRVFRCAWWVRHWRNGQASAWSSAGVHVDGCDPPTQDGGGGGTQI